jgi:fructose-bisphosphate aldolase class 1
MIPTDSLYIAAVIARNVINRLRSYALNRKIPSVAAIQDATAAIERLEAACHEHRHRVPGIEPELDLSAFEAAIDELEIDP